MEEQRQLLLVDMEEQRRCLLSEMRELQRGPDRSEALHAAAPQRRSATPRRSAGVLSPSAAANQADSSPTGSRRSVMTASPALTLMTSPATLPCSTPRRLAA